MPGDPTSRDDDDLLSQIDELKARMDRLMRGGSSTSNSALLTEEVKARQAESEDARSAAPPDPAPDRTRVRDLIGPEDTEEVEVYPESNGVVPFPENVSSSPQMESVPVAKSDPEPLPVPRPEPTRPVGGSVIPVEEGVYEPRPTVTTFDDLGSAIQQELARDSSVPPVDPKKGPDLASRFGPAVDRAATDQPAAPAVSEDVALPPSEEQAAVDEPEIEAQQEANLEAQQEGYEEANHGADHEAAYVEHEEDEVKPRSSAGIVAAIWAFAAIASGAIATLHFTGLI